ncbi:piggyBac transposable element-derived protein 4-like [Oppia nitens]|uniref:piggyBac transposable element-derived protein 4-like n=1 Tax=Oppia nitens TaxID=1686743 RepID=UPI0023DBA671|nr:piggyBac transposable element-derived protein 4-like [Oppia nitens]
MSRDRYFAIKRGLHFCDEETGDKSDEIYKVRMLLTHITQVSQHLYVPKKELSVDESLVAFKGQSGYMLNLLCHCGDESTSSTKDIVLKLLECMGEMSGHDIYTDNYYTSIELAEELIYRGMSLTGTLRKNRRGLPLNFKKFALKLSRKQPGPFYMRKDKICCMAWYDNKQVLALSTHLTKGEVNIQRRSRKSDTGFVTINSPNIIESYKKFMGGIDRYDQRLSYHSYPHRVLYWPQVIWHLVVSVSLNNSFIVYKDKTSKPISSSDFKYLTARRLLQVSEKSISLHACCSSALTKIDTKPLKRDCVMCQKLDNFVGIHTDETSNAINWIRDNQLYGLSALELTTLANSTDKNYYGEEWVSRYTAQLILKTTVCF